MPCGVSSFEFNVSLLYVVSICMSGLKFSVLKNEGVWMEVRSLVSYLQVLGAPASGWLLQPNEQHWLQFVPCCP